ncbi:SDR family NAD(P)-dependent oxidoreductase [Ancylobacter terrae]|uniref:SDR family NAD(P)-dependent oxidoreductase n=1 Tax=Ancylobacter sp. sgz301288 TaxID=3342077 RepID=UPI0038592742
MPATTSATTPHPALRPGNVAVVTGGASGIGLAAAKAFAALGLNVVIADLAGRRLDAAVEAVGGSAVGVGVDVSVPDDLERLRQVAYDTFARVDVLMNNAGIQPGSGIFGPEANWTRVIDVNLWGVIHGCQSFVPAMIESGNPGLVINTGSKQGITTPPGDPAYNVSKAALKVFTEQLQHELRSREGCRISAHLLIPGFVFTPLAARGRPEKPEGAWTAEQTVDFMLTRLAEGDFYILCPDNDVPRALDEKRILWAAGDIVENRPPLSRWHPDYGDRFAAFAAQAPAEEGLRPDELNASNDD